MKELIRLVNPNGKIALRDKSMIFKYVVYLMEEKDYLRYVFLDMGNNFIKNASKEDIFQN
jgi:hypothetical protein